MVIESAAGTILVLGNVSDPMGGILLKNSLRRGPQSSGLSAWLAQLTSRTHRNVAGVALANSEQNATNKLARMAWAVLAKNEQYRPPMLSGAATA